MPNLGVENTPTPVHTSSHLGAVLHHTAWYLFCPPGSRRMGPLAFQDLVDGCSRHKRRQSHRITRITKRGGWQAPQIAQGDKPLVSSPPTEDLAANMRASLKSRAKQIRDGCFLTLYMLQQDSMFVDVRGSKISPPTCAHRRSPGPSKYVTVLLGLVHAAPGCHFRGCPGIRGSADARRPANEIWPVVSSGGNAAPCPPTPIPFQPNLASTGN